MKKIFFASLLFIVNNTFCQEKYKGDDVVDITKITVLNLGVSYEKRIGPFQTLYLQAFMNIAATKTLGYMGETYEFYYDPSITAQYRYYYNSKSRNNKGLRTSMNNLNYLAPVYQVFFSKIPFTYYTTPEKRRPVHFVAAVWGIQRNYDKARFSLDLNIGPGVLFTNTSYQEYQGGPKLKISQSQFTLYNQINIGFWLNKRS